eukprot:m.124746 g.124746  ORF g.124746 m.124746 type:complete len:244 (-) comp15599_c0_seq1:179-910(-)
MAVSMQRALRSMSSTSARVSLRPLALVGFPPYGPSSSSTSSSSATSSASASSSAKMNALQRGTTAASTGVLTRAATSMSTKTPIAKERHTFKHAYSAKQSTSSFASSSSLASPTFAGIGGHSRAGMSTRKTADVCAHRIAVSQIHAFTQARRMASTATSFSAPSSTPAYVASASGDMSAARAVREYERAVQQARDIFQYTRLRIARDETLPGESLHDALTQLQNDMSVAKQRYLSAVSTVSDY